MDRNDKNKNDTVPSLSHSLSRRALVKGGGLLAGAATLGPLLGIRPARAATWPTRQVQVIVPYSPGGSADPLARIAAQQLSKQSGQGFVVENKPGGSATIGTADVARAPADGYTMLAITPTFVITQYIYPHLPYDGRKDLMPLGLLFTTPLMLLVHPSLPVHDTAEFLAYAKANPGKMTFSTSGVGSTPHLALELLKQQAGIDILHVPYQGGGPALTAILSGEVNTTILSQLEVSEHVKRGKLLPIAATSLQRTQRLADIPTLNESGVPGYEVIHYTGLVVRRAIPADTVQQMSAQLQKALADPEVKAKIMPFGDAQTGSFEDAQAIIDREHDRWSRVVKAANIKLD
jgi:tripartite-type tricarboxylate transporter receptor subunit TctC